jgi:hypothetical protein
MAEEIYQYKLRADAAVSSSSCMLKVIFESTCVICQ